VGQAREQGKSLTAAEIPFPETRAYVERVMRAQVEYRSLYARELGLT
jgi:soluble lytic murein transglycosylase